MSTDSTPLAGELWQHGVDEADRAYDDMAEMLEVNACNREALSNAILAYLAALPAQPHRIEGAGREEIAQSICAVDEQNGGAPWDWYDIKEKRRYYEIADAILTISIPQRMAGGDGAGGEPTPELRALVNEYRASAPPDIADQLQAVTAERDGLREALRLAGDALAGSFVDKRRPNQPLARMIIRDALSPATSAHSPGAER